LIYSADQEGNKDHLIKLLATFEEHNSAQGQDRPTYYLLFDWAEGDLARYWKANERFVGDPKHCVWMSDQFCGLAEGLQIIHNDRKENLKFLPANVSDPNVYGRHGDIKPGNILYFETGKSEAPEQSLVLADFGLGRLQTKYSRSKQDPRSLARTETYRSPEFDLPPPKGFVSPASDIFSLGCVFLEYISWYILGTKAVLEEFTNMRMAHDIYGFDVDIFFNVTTEPNGEQDAELKPSVKEWIQKLKKHRFCNDYINQMLDVIQDHMLDPNPETRWRSMKLVRELQAIKIACQRVPSFYTKNSNSSKSSHANTARDDPRNKEKPGSLTAYYQSKRGYRG
jgi:serine/threonine protein kinase